MTEPIPLLLDCPRCHERHIDEGEWATRPHHTHACQYCGHTWRPGVVDTVGVLYLPGFKNEPAPASRRAPGPRSPSAERTARWRAKRRAELLAVTLGDASRARHCDVTGDAGDVSRDGGGEGGGLLFGDQIAQKNPPPSSEDRKEDPGNPARVGDAGDAGDVTVTPPAASVTRIRTNITDDGAFGATEHAWRDGIRLATGQNVARLSPLCVRQLLALIDAHAGPSLTGQALVEWVRDIAAKWGRYAKACGRSTLSPEACATWITLGMQGAPAVARGRPQQPWAPGDFDLPKEMGT